MIGIAVLVVLALVVVAALWSRVASSRSERRSVEGYGRALDTLGGVARRSEASVSLTEREPTEIARPHVEQSAGSERHARPGPPPMKPVPRIRIRPPGPPGSMPVFSDLPEAPGGAEPSTPTLSPKLPSPAGRSVASTDDPTLVLPREALAPPARTGTPPPGTGGEAGGEPAATAPYGPVPVDADDEPLTMLLPIVRPEAAAGTPPVRVFDAEEAAEEGGGDGAGPPGDQERSQRMRRAATGAAAAVAIGALAAGGWQLAVDGSHAHPGAAATSGAGSPPAGSRTTPTSAPAASRTGSGSSTHGRGGTPGTTSPGSGALQPTSSSSSLVAYQAPASRYTITFSVSGSAPCWLGAQASQGGSYLWMQTVAPGQTATYSANGSVVIRIGAPPVVSVSVNGEKVALPPGNVQPYDISFTPANAA